VFAGQPAGDVDLDLHQIPEQKHRREE
jgi:hypothetical protein